MVIKHGGSSHAELTNNVAYVFLSILPLTTLIKNIFIKYFYLFVLMVFIFLGMKRGSCSFGCKVNKKFRENTHRGDNFVHGNTKKDRVHPNGEVWLAC